MSPDQTWLGTLPGQSFKASQDDYQVRREEENISVTQNGLLFQTVSLK